MADVLHKTTLQFIRSVNTPDFDPGTWVISPASGRAAIEAIPQRYRKLVANDAAEMTAGEKAVVDAATETTRRAKLPIGIQVRRESDGTVWNLTIGAGGSPAPVLTQVV